MNLPPRYAGILLRSLAWILDLFLLATLFSPLLYGINQLAATHIQETSSWMLFHWLRFALVFAVSLTVLSQTTARLGGTPGKVLLGLQVLNRNGQWLQPRQALGRILLSIPVIASVIGILMMLFDARRRTFHDRVLNTVVIAKYHDYAEDPMPGEFR